MVIRVSGSPNTGDRIVAHGAPLVVEGERQRRETGRAETRDHVRAAIRGTQKRKNPPPPAPAILPP